MALATVPRYPGLLSLDRARDYHRQMGGSDEEQDILRQLADRKYGIQAEQDDFAALCDRWDNLYFPQDVLPHAGASHWAEHPSAHTPGRSHVSINVPPVYVDVPASLQSVTPIENMVANGPDEAGRALAGMVERLFFAWKDQEDFDLKGHMACVTKGLYGRTAAKVWWDNDEGRPRVGIVDQPRNLYLGWGSSDYTTLNWCLYTYRLSCEQVLENWGLETAVEDVDGYPVPYVMPRGYQNSVTSFRQWPQNLEIEVYDYWYRRPKAKQPKGSAKSAEYRGLVFETCNAIFVGNVCVKSDVHPEYAGSMPYVPLFNTYIPGVPNGRPELFDIEPLIREKDERMSAGAQMIQKAIDGQFWQLVGPEAPDVVPTGVVPKPNKVIAPGAGNRVESVEPWMPEFQLDAYLNRIDRELSDVSGLNDLLRGMAPATVLSSSKAITALVANYEARIRIKRDLFYKWRREVWELATQIWGAKNAQLRPIIVEVAHLEQVPPSLTPRDDSETAVMAANLVSAKLWSQKRGMDRVGVDDPETEADIIREERTDAAMFPADVMTMAQLMGILQSLGVGGAAGAEEQAAAQAQSLAAYRQQLGGQTGTPSMNGPGEQAQMPPEGLPSNTEGSMVPPAPAAAGELQPPTAQVQTLAPGEGEAQTRLVTKQNVPLPPAG